jgi:hypothetical protein
MKERIAAIIEIVKAMADDLWQSAKSSDYGVMALCFFAGAASAAVIALLL